MEWNLKIRGEEVTYTILQEETAVKLPDDSLHPTFAMPTTHLGEVIGDEPFEGTNEQGLPADRDVFRRAGWHFVRPLPEIAAAAETMSLLPQPVTVRQVILSEQNATMIDSDLATVRFQEDVSEEQALSILKEDGLSIVYRLGFAPKTFEVRLPPGLPVAEVINKLQAKTDRYLYAEPSLLQIINERLTPQVEPGISVGEQWQHSNNGLDMGSLTAWQITRGARKRKIRVAVIDNGMQISHPDLAAGILGGGFFKKVNLGEAEFIPYTPGMTDFPDRHHGTFCLGLVGARLNGKDGCGLAPEADLMPIACLRDQIGTQTTLARAVAYAADPSKEGGGGLPDQGADVISCSLNTQRMLNSNLQDAITFAVTKGRGEKGVPVFWAVSNTDTPISEDKLFDHRNLIAIGRYDRTGERVRSGFGPRLEYLAPGQDVFSTGSSSNFESGDGTSFATPLAAGVAALVLSIQPDWTAEQVREHLQRSCEPPDREHDNELGFGRLSAKIAVEKAKPADL